MSVAELMSCILKNMEIDTDGKHTEEYMQMIEQERQRQLFEWQNKAEIELKMREFTGLMDRVVINVLNLDQEDG